MAYRGVSVLEIKEVLRLWRQGVPKKQIAARLGLDPKTVRRYLAAAQAPPEGAEESSGTAEDNEAAAVPPGAALPPPEAGPLPPTPTDEEVADVVIRLRSGSVGRTRGESWSACEAKRELIAKHLKDRVRLSKIRRLLKREGVEIPYATLHRFAVAELGFGRHSPTIPVSDGEPGHELQVDTGWMTMLEPDEKGKRRRFRAWIFTAGVSRLRFVYPCFKETTESAIEACEAAWDFYEGVFRVLLPDNTKAIVTRHDPLEPLINRTFLEYAQKRGFAIDPARARKPRDKARVERSVQDVREDCYGGEKLRTLDDAEKRGLIWSRQEYGLRRHTRTQRIPQEHFDAEEKARLLPAPTEPYEIPIWTTSKVHLDQHAQVAKGLYSLPREFRRQELVARADSKLVLFYSGQRLVKTHPRVPAGKRSTDRADFPIEKVVYAQRDAAWLCAEAAKQGAWVGLFAIELLKGPAPWRAMRQAFALIGLARKHPQRTNEACRAALEAGAVSVKRIQNMVRNGVGETPTARPTQSPAPARFLCRGPRSLRLAALRELPLTLRLT